MKIIVRISAPLKCFTEGKTEVVIIANDVAGCLHELTIQFPALREKLWNEQGELNGFINIYIDGVDIRILQDLATPLKKDDEISIVPAIAGG